MALPKLKKNSVSTTLSAEINDSATTIPVLDLAAFHDADGNLITDGIVIGFDDADETAAEEITVTGASATSGAGNLTGATRGVKADGTIGAASAWVSGTAVAVMFSTGIYEKIKDEKADLASPALTGTPTAPTAAVGTMTTQIATTEFVLQNQGSFKNPLTAIYGVVIDEDEEQPESRVTYIDDAVGMVPMRGGDGNFDWGSWKHAFYTFGIKPCIVNPNGTVSVYLDPDDYAKDVDGNAVDITGSGATGTGENVCVEIPTIWYQMQKVGTKQYMRFSLTEQTGYLALAHTRDPLYGTVAEGELSASAVIRDKIYMSVYNGWTDGGSKQRSLSGKTPTVSITHPVAQTRCRANGSGWEMTPYAQRCLMSVLFTVFFKSTDSQTALGKGATNTTVKNTGTRNASGMFYGSTNAAEVLKFCGIEAPFDNLLDWVDGLYSTIGTDPPNLGTRKLCIATDNFNTVAYTGTSTMADVNPTPDNWKVLGTGFAANQNGYVKTIHGGTETGIVQAAVGGGSETTHYCDYGRLRAGCLAFAGGGYANVAHAGAFYVYVYSTAADSYATIGARASFIGAIV